MNSPQSIPQNVSFGFLEERTHQMTHQGGAVHFEGPPL